MSSIKSLICWKSKNFFLHVKNPQILVQCKWPINDKIFLAYRILTALYFTANSLVVVLKADIFWIYLTYWAYLHLTIAFILNAISAIKYSNWLKSTNDEEICELLSYSETPILLQISWMFITIATNFALVGLLIYWILLAPDICLFNYLDYTTHGPNGILVLVDTFLCARPTYMEHIYLPITFGFLYSAFTAFYWAAGGTDTKGNRTLYEGMSSWDHLDQVLLTILCLLLFIIVCQVISICVSLIRDEMYNLFRQRKKENAEKVFLTLTT